MSGVLGGQNQGRRGLRRKVGEERERQRELTLRHRWYAGGVATLLSGALIFAGVGPATAAEVTPPPSDTTSAETPPAEGTTPPAEDSTPPAEETTPAAEETTPPVEETTPPVEETTPPAGEETAPPADEETTPPAEEETPGADESAQPGKKASSAKSPNAGVVPMSIVDPTPVPNGKTTLQIKKLGARNSGGGVDPVAGAVFYAYDGTRNGTRPTPGTTTTALTCTTDANGLCQIVVDNRTAGSGNSTQGYWVYEGTAPSGWNRLGSLGLGDYDGPKTSSPYMFFTSNVSGSSTIWEVPLDATGYFGGSTTTTTKTAQNAFANVRSNPAFPSHCGLSIAMVFDTSSSISSSEMTSMKNAAKSFVASGALGGTPSSVALYRFSTTASKFLNSTSIATTQTTVNNAIDGLPSAGDGYTNWDDAFRKVAFNGTESYDVVLFLTDGDPTVSGTAGANEELSVGFRNLEEGVFSANAVKNMTGPAGTRTKIVGVGIGLSTNSVLNLAAISGPTANEDYYTTDFPGLASRLNQIALANCGGTLTVIKKTVDADGSTIDATAGDWTFTGSTSGSWIKTGGGNVSSLALTTPTSGVSEGAVNFPIDLTGTSSRNVTVVETQKSGWTPLSVACTGATASGTAANFTVPVGINAVVSCTVTNKQLPPTTLTINKAFANTYGAPAVPGDWTLTATNGGNTTNFVHGVAQNVTANTPYVIGEVLKTGYEQVSVTCTGGTFNSTTKAVTVAPNTSATCTVTNRDKPASLQIVKQDLSGNGLAGATFQVWKETGAAAGLQTSNPNQDTLVSTVSAGTTTVPNLAWGMYHVKETVAPTGYDIASPDTQTVTLGAADTATVKVVTFKNAPQFGSLKIEKALGGAGGVVAGTTFTVTYDCGAGYAGTVSTLSATAPITISSIPVGRICTVVENTSLLVQSQLVDVSFAWDTKGQISGPQTIAGNTTKTITVTNTTKRVYGSIAVTKALAGGISVANLIAGASFSGSWSCTYGAGPALTGTWTVTGVGAATLTGPWNQIPLTSTCSVTETAPADSLFADQSYSWASRNVSPGSAAVNSSTVPTSFTVTNTAQRTSLKLDKVVINSSGGTLTGAAWNGKLHAGALTFNDEETKNVPAGPYALSEDAVAGYVASGAVTCQTTGGTSVPVSSGSVTIAKGQAVVCTFTNVDVAPKLTLRKIVDNKDGVGTRLATEWTLSATETGQDAVIDEQGETADEGETATTGTVEVESNVAYLLDEEGPFGYDGGSWTCDGGEFSAGAITLQPGDDVLCSITNTAQPATGEHRKAVKRVEQLADGTWEIEYTITVENTSDASTLVYDLDDELLFGSGIDVIDASWSDATVTDEPFDTEDPWTAVLADGAALPQNQTGHAEHVYTVTVHAAIDEFPGARDEWQECSDDDTAGGFLNRAGLTVVVGEPVDEFACAEPSFPTIVKSGLPSEQDPETGAWTVSYEIKVANPGDVDVHASVSDLFPTVPSGWTLTGGEWAVTSTEPALDLSLAPNGSAQDIWAGAVPAGETFTFTVRGVLQPTSAATAIGPCDDEEGGLINTATVWSGAGSASDVGCADTDVATVDVEKDAKSVEGNADGSWLITYGLTVTNESSDITAVYDLVESPRYGDGVTPTAARWAPADASGTPTGAWTDFDLTAPPLTIANDRPLTGGGVEHYVVEVTATIDPDAWTGDDVLSLGCPPDEGSGADEGGLLNSATATAGDVSDTGEDCIVPSLPTIDKSAVGAVQQDDPSQWAVTFNLTVTGQGTDTYYDLADVPDFVTGVDIVGPGTAIRTDAGADPDAEPVSVPVPVEGEDPVPFVTDVALGGDGVQVWQVTWIVDIPGQVLPPELRECTEQGGGFTNRALLTVGDVTQTDEDCIPVKEKVYPDVTKTVTGLSRDPDTKVWEIVYKIEVKLAANADNLSSEYDLVEALEFDDIEVEDASWSGYTSGTFADGAVSAQIASNRPIASGATHTYNVVVHATIEPGDLVGHTIGCTTVGQTRGVGFFNKVTLTSDDATPIVREACTEPEYPDVAKTAPDVEVGPGGTQRLEYQIVVTAPEPKATGPVTNIIYRLEEQPAALPTGVVALGPWHVEKVNDDAPTPTQSEFDGNGTWLVRALGIFTSADRTDGHRVHTFKVWRDVKVTAAPTAEGPEPCTEGGDGIAVWNTVQLSSGEFTDSAEACDEVDYDDVSLEKTSLLPFLPDEEGRQTSVEPGDEFDYVLTVTNNGTRPAQHVRITDLEMNERLDLLSLSVSGGHTYTGGIVETDDDHGVDLTLDGQLAVGESVTITIHAAFLASPVGDGGLVPGGQIDDPQFADPLESLENTACVAADGDANPDNNCDDETIPTRDITATIYATCVSDAPLLGWAVKKSSLVGDLPATLTWVPDNPTPLTDPASVVIHEEDEGPVSTTWSGLRPWPGAVFTPQGVAIDYPGWRPLRASDYDSLGRYLDPQTHLVMSEATIQDKIFNGLIFDNAELDYAWRFDSTVTISVNPELEFSTAYPPATPECFSARHTELDIQKAASVEKTDPGKSFTYTIDVSNVSDDSAASDVVVTDVIPDDIKITDVSWVGEGDSTAFPTWTSCDVTGEDASGYGGTLVCNLFGPLQPIGAEGTSAAPQITLTATVDPASIASAITNVAVVDYHTFGDPEDPGRDVDDATVLLSGLPVTGGTPAWPLVMLGFLALLAGVAGVVVSRRRKGEPHARV